MRTCLESSSLRNKHVHRSAHQITPSRRSQPLHSESPNQIHINNEIRWPVFKYFIRKPIQSDFIRNFQLIAFGDIGSAWTGWDPYSKDNSLNKQTIVSGPLTVVVNTNREPIVGGYGWGMRFKFMGYFIRTDWAWGIADGTRTDKPIFYLSLSKDI